MAMIVNQDWVGPTINDVEEAEEWRKYNQTPYSKGEYEFLRKTNIPKYQWKISKHRRDKRTGVISPVIPSKYFKYLVNEGAGWNE